MDETGRILCLCCSAEGKQGIMVAGHFLCEECQSLMLRSLPGDPEYDALIERCKAIWRPGADS